jgi:hypothetical protein
MLLVSAGLFLVLVGLPRSTGPSLGKTEANDAIAPEHQGVEINDARAFAGYTLVFPLWSRKTYLVDLKGRVVHMWQSRYLAGQDAHLLENGHLLRSADLAKNEAYFAGGSRGGRVQELTWDGELVWDYRFHSKTQRSHHAVCPMPNGNVMMIVWERKIRHEAIAAGVKPELAGKGDMLVDALFEVKPIGRAGGQIVWEWHTWDHLIQDHDKSKRNYGDVAAHPELLDADFARRKGAGVAGLLGPVLTNNDDPKQVAKDGKRKTELNVLKGLGYIGGGGQQLTEYLPDWTHVNSVFYNARLDQLMLCSREFGEVWIIDHSTTSAQARGHEGGRYGKGGDILYRWGNPRAYRAGTLADQKLFAQHDAHWIPEGLPGAGHMLVFNNGARPDGLYSSVDEIVLPVDAEGRYTRPPGKPYGPPEPVWSYTAPKKTDFYAIAMSGAQRLPNGNTLIAAGFGGALFQGGPGRPNRVKLSQSTFGGTIFEVTPEKEIVWKYKVPIDFEPGDSTTGSFEGVGNPVFRVYRYAPTYPGLAGRELTPGRTIEELASQSQTAKR